MPKPVESEDVQALWRRRLRDCELGDSTAVNIHGVLLHDVYIFHWGSLRSLVMAVELLFPKLAVFGASGPMGRLLVQQALAKGHVVCAIVRSPEKFDMK